MCDEFIVMVSLVEPKTIVAPGTVSLGLCFKTKPQQALQELATCRGSKSTERVELRCQ